jgi:hypothetical protein
MICWSRTRFRRVSSWPSSAATAGTVLGRDRAARSASMSRFRATRNCVAGPHPTVILTTAALRALNPDQVDAVLAHERAHLASHHHLLLAIARIGRQVFPFLPLMREADAQIARLVEMHADDAATADRDAGPLATALVILANAGGPAPGFAAATTDAVQRIQRLLRPAAPMSRPRRRLLSAGAAVLALAPVLLALTPAVLALALGRVPGA